MSGKRLTTGQRAERQKVMMALRRWMETNEVSRIEVASRLNITVGHLSTLINANRTPSQEQVDIANELMGCPPLRHQPPDRRPVTDVRPTAAKTKTTSTNLRPLTKAEGDFVALIAQAWIKETDNATQDDLVEIVRALSIAIRS